MKRKVFLRADAGPSIGYGHFMRTLALADMLKDYFPVTLFTQTPTSYQEKAASGICPLVPLPADAARFDMFLSALSGDEIVVLDNYFFSTAYQCEIKAKGCRLVCIDDMHDRHYAADVVVNHGIEDGSLFDIEPYTELCLGLEWALLRRPFLEVLESGKKSRLVHSGPQEAVICMGGSDPFHLTRKILQELLPFRDRFSIVRVIAGSQVDVGEEGLSGVEVFRDLSARSVCDLLRRSDMGIFSASTICIEALSVGLPCFVGYYMDNQKDFYDYIARNGYIRELGNLLEGRIWDNEKIRLPPGHFDTARMRGIAGRYRNLFLRL